MSSFSCPHLEVAKDFCLRLRTDCVPGRKGCVVPKSTVFLVPAEERVALREAQKQKQPLPSVGLRKKPRKAA